MGRRLLHSSCDFLSLPHETPNHWRLALKAHGTLRGLVPYDGSPEAQNDRSPETIYRHAEHNESRTVRVGGHWSLGRVLMEPLFYNPDISGRWGAATLDPETYAPEQRQRKGAGASDPKICCWSQERDTDAKEVYDRSKRFAALGLTHIAHMLEPGRTRITWAGIKGLARSKETQTPCTPEEFDAFYRGIPECWYEVLDLLAGGANTHNPPSIQELIRDTPLSIGSWVSLTTNGMRIITQTGGSSKLQWLEHGDMRE